MSTPIVPQSPAEVNRDSLRVDMEHIDRALQLMSEARQWLRDVDGSDEARIGLTGVLADTHALRRCVDATLIVLEGRNDG